MKFVLRNQNERIIYTIGNLSKVMVETYNEKLSLSGTEFNTFSKFAGI